MNTKHQWISIALTMVLGIGAVATIAQAEPLVTTEHETTTTTTQLIGNTPAVSPAIENKVHMMSVGLMHPELAAQLKSKKGGSIAFWEAVSWCETNHDWNDGGYFSGGLGMAQSVWEGYGGKQFASRPPKATKEEQIIVANRMAFFGYQTKNVFRTLDDKLNNKPFFRPAIGWRNASNWGRDCANWKTRKPARARYTEAGMTEWLKTRPVAKKTVEVAGLSGKVSSQSFRPAAEIKRCPQWESQLKAHGLVPVARFSYIMWRESRCLEKIVSKKNSNGSKDYGLLQINSSWKTLTARVCGSKFGNLAPLLTAKCNLKVAKALLDNGGMGHWSATSGAGS
jgi:hypothetical protein